MSAEDNKAMARRYWDEVWSTGNVAIVDEIFAPDLIFHTPGGEIAFSDTEAQKRGPTKWHTAFPDFCATIEDIVAEGDKVVVRWTVRGTHRGNIEIESAGLVDGQNSSSPFLKPLLATATQIDIAGVWHLASLTLWLGPILGRYLSMRS